MGRKSQEPRVPQPAGHAEGELALTADVDTRIAAHAAGAGVRFIRLCRSMRDRLSKPRYRHALCVARTAEKLARRHGASCAAARTAGILHDIAREWTPAALLGYAGKFGLPVSKLEVASPLLLHARVGADVAQREFGVADSDTLAAIATHTVAEPGMSELQKILFVADTVEPNRTYAGREALEAVALRSLDEGLLGCVKASMEYLLARGVPIAPQTLEVYNTLVERYGTTA